MKVTVKKGEHRLMGIICSIFLPMIFSTTAMASGAGTQPKTATKVNIVSKVKVKQVSTVAKTKATTSIISPTARSKGISTAKYSSVRSRVNITAKNNMPAAMAVSDYYELSSAIGSKAEIIDVKVATIDFLREIAVRRDNITINGLEKDGSRLDMKGRGSFFGFSSGLDEIQLKNLEFVNGKNKDEIKRVLTKDLAPDDNYIQIVTDNGGGALRLRNSLKIAFVNSSFINNVAVNGHGGAIFTEERLSLIFDGNTVFKDNSCFDQGGALYLDCPAIFRGTTLFEGNNNIEGDSTREATSKRHYHGSDGYTDDCGAGGAIMSRSNLTFEEEAIFRNNSSYGSGGAICASREPLIFIKTAMFDGNKIVGNKESNCYGGGLNLSYSHAIFEDRAIFINNTSPRIGGAISAEEGYLIFNGPTEFKNNKSGCGGAIYTSGKDEYSKIGLTVFRKNTIFANNIASEKGGAIFSASKIFGLSFEGEEVIFKDNIAKNGGGAMYIDWVYRSEKENPRRFNFGGKTVFEGNKTDKDGGAIRVRSSNLIAFGKETIFVGNAAATGGAVYMDSESTLTCDGPVILEKNYAYSASAIFVKGAKIKFNSGLKVIGNTVESEILEETTVPDGAIYMIGEKDTYKHQTKETEIEIIQNSRTDPTIFEGNISNGRPIAIYMKQDSILKFTIDDGNVDLCNGIEGCETENSNTVNINSSVEGWLNFKKGGFLNNVNLISEGNLNLFDSETIELKLMDFKINSGKIRFGIFPENNKCSRITGNSITVKQGTILNPGATLEIVAAPGTYIKGNSYDILVSEKDAIGKARVNVKMPKNLKAKMEFIDRFCRICIEEESTIEADLDE
ncbi:MAG: hypothetical protein LBB13_02875 [Rickettsiales bacterium]|jgi:predicted outer membrane repeat protein|nr:hypothetical protein [Rickettsiales bacterium]